MFFLRECGRILEIDNDLSSCDINIFQEAILLSSSFATLRRAQLEATAFYGVTTLEQCDEMQTAHWYIDGIDMLISDLESREGDRDPVNARLSQILGLS